VSGQTPYRAGDAVRHRRFGTGVVTAATDGMVVVSLAGEEKTFIPELAPMTKVDDADDAPPDATASADDGTGQTVFTPGREN